MKNMKEKVLFIVLMFIMSGCSLEASIEALSKVPSTVFSAANAKGLIPGSNQAGTAGDYNIQSSVGNYKSDMQQVTTDGSYEIRSSVQGTLAR
jgi:hypothetical protein